MKNINKNSREIWSAERGSREVWSAERGTQEVWSAERVKDLTMSRITTKSNTYDMEQKQRKRPVFKAVVSFALEAAVICLMVFGGTLMFPYDGYENENENVKVNVNANVNANANANANVNAKSNIFELKAYAMELQGDGSIEQREVDLLNESHGWSFNDDGENVYINTWLKCEGENIKSVDFYVDEGFFAKQYIIRDNGQVVKDGVTMMGSDSTIMQYGNDYMNVGSHFTLNADEMTDDLLVFWGRESRRIGSDLNLPSELTIRAVATFSDGKTQEEGLVLDLTTEEKQGFGTIKLTDEEIAQDLAESLRFDAFLHNIPLDQCEVVPGSERILTYGDTFEYDIGSTSNTSETLQGTAMFPITEESMDPSNDQAIKQAGFKGLFDENGVARFGSSANLFNLWDEYDGSDGYIAVIETNGDGTFIGKTYKVPGWLILECME